MKDKPDETEILLPWMANDTLSDEERARVADYLVAHPAESDELEFLKAVREGVSKQQSGSPGAFGLRRLQNAIRQEQQTSESTLANQPAANDRNWWKVSLAAAAMVIMVQGSLLLTPFMKNDEGIQPLGVEQGTGLVLQVEFQPSATESQIRQLLEAVNGRLIDGPSAVGIYRLQIDRNNLETADIDRLINELETASMVIKYVEQN